MSNFAVPFLVSELMRDFGCPWAICGGWAADLFLDRVTRPHKDIEIAIFRADQRALHDYLSGRGWTMVKIIDHTRYHWEREEFLELPIHEIHCTRAGGQPDFLEVLLNENNGGEFAFRRDGAMALPLNQALLRSRSGLPMLAPEIVLLYKSKSLKSEGNAADFESLLPRLAGPQKAWLARALRRFDTGHPWLARLSTG